MTQKEALDLLMMGRNIYLTGQAGSGKTYLLNLYIDFLKKRKVGVAITASTGIAATHINGSTVHSWSGIGIKRKLTSRDLSDIGKKGRVAQRVKKAHVLIIDEVSMLTADALMMVEAVCRKIRNDKVLFGGLQVVLVGDFFQLPPVVPPEFDTDGQRSLIMPDIEYLRFAFSASIWQTLNLHTCYLLEQHR